MVANPLSEQIQEILDQNKEIKKIDRKIVFVGHVVFTKGVFELVAACKQIESIKLKLVGYVTASVKEKLLKLAGVDGFNWLEIVGEQNYNTTIKEILSANVFVLPTHTEGFPNVILESMACGCSIVTTSVGAIPEMLDISQGAKNGLCIPPRDVTKLREAINEMLNKKQYALECGRNAQIRVNRLYNMPTIWSKLENLWYN